MRKQCGQCGVAKKSCWIKAAAKRLVPSNSSPTAFAMGLESEEGAYYGYPDHPQ